MCVIVDANVGHEVFGPSQSEAGEFLLSWLNRGGRPLVIGGRLLVELGRNAAFVMWIRTAQRAGRARRISDEDVDAQTDALRTQGVCRSDDEHVLALARISGARLLFTNDNALQDDFRDRQIIGGRTQGRIYTTQLGGRVTRAHRDLLRR